MIELQRHKVTSVDEVPHGDLVPKHMMEQGYPDLLTTVMNGYPAFAVSNLAQLGVLDTDPNPLEIELGHPYARRQAALAAAAKPSKIDIHRDPRKFPAITSDVLRKGIEQGYTVEGMCDHPLIMRSTLNQMCAGNGVHTWYGALEPFLFDMPDIRREQAVSYLQNSRPEVLTIDGTRMVVPGLLGILARWQPDARHTGDDHSFMAVLSSVYQQEQALNSLVADNHLHTVPGAHNALRAQLASYNPQLWLPPSSGHPRRPLPGAELARNEVLEMYKA